METDPAVTLEKMTAEYRRRFQQPGAQLEIVVPSWWVEHWGHEALAAASARLNVTIRPVDTWEDTQDQLSAIVHPVGTWHVERGPTLDLSGARHDD